MNHTVKRTTAAILAALILAGTTAAAATFAAPTIAHATEGAGTGTVKDSGSCGAKGNETDVTWQFTNDGTLTISGSGAMEGYIISSSGTDAPWKNYRDSIKEVVIDSGITYIASGSFADCTNLIEVTFAENSTLQEIDDSAFARCTGLTSVTIPKSVASIGDGVFYDCTSLATVIMERTTPPNLGSAAFYETKLNTILVPAGRVDAYKQAWNEHADKIQEGPYGYCGAEDNTGGVESVKWAFNPATGKLTISGSGKMAYNVSPEGVPWYNYRSQITSVVIENGVTSIGNAVFYDYSNLESVNISASVTSIGDTAFFGCKSLTSITIPSGVINIGSSAFYNCTDLTIVTMEGETPPTLESIVFENTSLNTILVPATALSAYQDACDKSEKGWKGEYKNMLAIGGNCGASTNEGGVESVKWVFNPTTNTLTISGSGKMANYDDGRMPWKGSRGIIETVVVENGVTSIGNCAFYSCTGLENISIPVSVTEIGNSAFQSCITLKDVTFAKGSKLQTIKSQAFSACYALKTIMIPAGVTSIEEEAFRGCLELKNIDIPKGVISIEDQTFDGCVSLTTVKFAEENQLQSIGKLAFYRCSYLTNIEIPSNVTSIGERAFEECSRLQSVTIPSNVKEINTGTFQSCTSLKTITIPESVTSIGENAFAICPALKTIDLPEKLKTINLYAFAGSGLTGVTIPKSVDFIGIGAFSVCEHLDSVIMERETPCAVGPNIFGDENSGSLDTRSKFVKENTEGITVPYGSLNAYQTTGYWAAYKDYMQQAPNPNPPAPSVPSQTATLQQP